MPFMKLVNYQVASGATIETSVHLADKSHLWLYRIPDAAIGSRRVPPHRLFVDPNLRLHTGSSWYYTSCIRDACVGGFAKRRFFFDRFAALAART
jgi:hypothetical protein